MDKTKIVSKLKDAAGKSDLKTMTRVALLATTWAKETELDDGSAANGVEHEYTRLSINSSEDNAPEDLAHMAEFLRKLADDFEQRPDPELKKQ